jgi:mRNA interferase HigB
VRIIKEAFVKDASVLYPKAAKYLEAWRKIVRLAEWRSLPDVRKTYASADAVTVRSKRTVTVFNVCGNDYRLIVAIHYKSQIVYMLRFLTHADYSKDKWKDEL